MITLKNKDIAGNQALIAAFQKLNNSPVPIATAKVIHEIAKALDAKTKAVFETHLAIVQKYCNKNEDGSNKMNGENYDIAGHEQEIQSELNILSEQETEIALPKINEKELTHARLTPNEWQALMPFISQGSELKLV